MLKNFPPWIQDLSWYHFFWFLVESLPFNNVLTLHSLQTEVEVIATNPTKRVCGKIASTIEQ